MNVRWLLVTVLLLLVARSLPAAQARNPAANPAIAKAKEHVTAARKEADAARAAEKAAEAALAKVRAKAKEQRDKIQAEHDSTPEMTAARTQAEQDRKAYETLSVPLLAKLKQSSEYLAALKAFEVARTKFTGAARETDAAEFDRLSKQYQAAQAAPRNLELAAIDADPKAKAAKAAQTESGGKLHALIEKRDAAIAKDPRLSAIFADFKEAEAKLAQAKSKLATEVRQLSEAERKVKAEEQKAAAHKPQPKKSTKRR